MRFRIAVAAVVCLGGCGSDQKRPAHAGLTWDGPPQVFRLRDLPSDRVLVGQVVNRSAKTLHLSSARLTVRDAAGRKLKSSGAYTATFGHGLYGVFQQPSKVPQPEAARLGRAIYLIPKDRSPFFAAWRIPPGSKGPYRIDYGAGPALEVPVRVRAASG